MLSMETAFDERRKRPNIPGRLILHISAESPATDFYFSDIDFWLGTTMIYGLVKSWGNISASLNLFSKQSRTSNVSVKLVNNYYKAPGGVLKSISETLDATKFINRTASIYVWLEGITQLSDCLKVFEGIVQSPKDVTPELITLPIKDSTFLKHKILPETVIDETAYPDAPLSSIGKRLPLVYGAFSKNAELIGNLSECVWTASDTVTASDVPLDSVSGVWIWDPHLEDYAKVDSGDYTVTLDDSGKTTIKFNDISAVTCWAYLYPNRYVDYEDNGQGIADEMFYVEDISKCYDQDDSTNLGIYRCRDPNDGYINCHFRGNLGGLADLELGASGNQFVEAKSYEDGKLSKAEIKIYDIDLDLPASNTLDLRNADHTASYTNAEASSSFNSRSYNWSDISEKLCIKIECESPDEVTHAISWNLYEIRMRTKYKPSFNDGIRVFVECEGRQYGSWIDASGRSNSYSAGEIIKHPAFIIEDILRRDLGFATADIDVSSFDNMASEISDWETFVSLNEQIYSLDLIMEICKQSISNFYIDSQGKAKVMVFKSSYTEDDTLYENQIKKGKFKLSKSSLNDLVNNVIVNYNYDKGAGLYLDYIEADNSTSQSDYNVTKELQVNANMIFSSAVADDLKDHFVGSSGFWKDLRNVLEFESNTWELIHWDIGDIIETDISLDNIVKCFSESWQNKKFMIIEKKVTPSGSAFKMIDVTGGGGAPT